jgi:DNA polymerase-3 subunit alpha
LPDFPVPEGLSMAEFFSQESKAGLSKRLEGLEVEREIYDERLF